MVGIRNLLIKGICHNSFTVFSSFRLTRIFIQLICVHQGIDVIHLHIIAKLIGKSNESSITWILTLIDLSRWLRRRYNFIFNLSKDIFQFICFCCYFVICRILTFTILRTGSQLLISLRIRIIAGQTMHKCIKFFFSTPWSTSGMPGNADIRTAKYTNGVNICICFYRFCRCDCIVSHIIIKTRLVIRLSICKKYNNSFDILSIGVIIRIGFTLIHKRLCQIHRIIRCCTSCRLQGIDCCLPFWFISTCVSLISTDNLCIIIPISVLTVLVISNFVRLITGKLHNCDTILLIHIRPLIIDFCWTVNKTVHCSFKCIYSFGIITTAHRIIHTSRYIKNQYDIQRHCSLPCNLGSRR